MADKIHAAMQENCLTLLVHSDEHGKIVANLVDPALFEGDYRVIAERAVDYWRQHNKAPHFHMGDLLADIIEDQNNRRGKVYRQILQQMLQLSEGINAVYVTSQLKNFIRGQRMKDAVLKSAELLNAKEEMAIGEVEEIWNNLLRLREIQFDPGLRLGDVDHLLTFLQRQYSEFSTGIPQLDSRQIVPARGAALIFLAPPGKGKTWFLISLGKQAFLHRRKVVHISLEMSEEEVLQRYYQSLWSVPKRDQEINVLGFQTDKLGKLIGLKEEKSDFEFSFDQSTVRDELIVRANWFGNRVNNLVIKRFPPRSLTANGIRAYLDSLELTQKFIPDLLILDYVGIMQTDAKNHRISLGRAFEDLRAIAVERNIALATAHQISREGAQAHTAQATHVAEDWSLIATADIILSFSSTDAEKRLGLGRLFVDKARTEEDKFSLILTQSYPLGQFCLSAHRMESRYFDLLKELAPDNSEEESD